MGKYVSMENLQSTINHEKIFFMASITITRPDDCHVHFRDLTYLTTTVNATARTFARAIVMPNLVTPVTHVAQALAYRQRILAALSPANTFQPLMALYLTDQTTAQDIIEATNHTAIIGYKWYPAGATTHSESGVTDIRHLDATLAMMEEKQLPLLIHGEVTDASIDIFDREKIFIETVLEPLRQRFPQLRIVLEHITTQEAVHYIMASPSNIAATITIHHLLYNRNALLTSGIHPHFYCLPVLKRRIHQEALIQAAISGHPQFFLGTDSAPHPQSEKECACGKAGIFSAPVALELYATVFAAENALAKLEGFASHHGAAFYRLPYNTETITLEKTDWQVPENYPLDDKPVVPLFAGKRLAWKIKN